MVISRQGIVAASQPLAAQAGAQILHRGGSAADAAVATNAMLGLVEPMMNGIGGDLFVIYYEARTGKLTGLNASGPAPHRLTPEFLAASGETAMPSSGIHAVTVPGSVDGWAKMHARFGKLPWATLFEPALAYATEGFPVSEVIQELWSAPATIAKLQQYPESAKVFLPQGRAPELGEVFRNPSLAAAYGLLAQEGPEAFYKGQIAQAILTLSERMGGTLAADDLAQFSAEWVEPLSIDYHGWTVYELPPNGQGMAALEMLNLMETLPVSRQGPLTGQEFHRRIEAMKLAYADCYRYNADPRLENVPVSELLSKHYAKQRASLIQDRANADVPPGRVPTANTIYLAAVDREGNIASWIQSVFSSFGSGITVPGFGFELQNRGAAFTLDPGHPNRLAGGKRPYHTIIPGFLRRGPHHIGFGIMGGANQPLAHAQFVSNIVDYRMNLQQALEAPRFFKGGPSGLDVALESRLPENALWQLSEKGHEIALRPEYSQEMGRGQAVLHDSETKTNFAGSDPRSDGAAIAEPLW